jgi:hypothetical protein
MLEKLVERLEATERNFLFSKDQRTLELANNELDDRLFDRVERMFSILKREKTASERAGSHPSIHAGAPGS